MSGLRTWSALAVLAVAVLLLPSGCGREWLAEKPGRCVFDSECLEGYRCINNVCVRLQIDIPDGGPHLKQFGERCQENEECQSTYCLAHPVGSFCTRLCTEGCPSGWECEQVPDPHGGPGTVGLCAVVQNRLCQPCTDNQSCNVTGADQCLTTGDGKYCSIDCTYSPCPSGYTCQEMTSGTGQVHQCLPTLGTCLCTDKNAGMVRGCQKENAHGVCTGSETCHPPAGWEACSAREPLAESCNGLDDDCNGFIDDDLEGAVCSNANSFGTCQGVQECHGFDGWVCNAPTPAAEVCDGLDNDCDGRTDEDFRDDQGRYVSDQHCGSCGVDCAVMIPHASKTKCELVQLVPRCRVLECQPGYFPYADNATCLVLPANLCQPCNQDQDCLAPGNACIDTGTEKFCGRDCSSSSPYGPGCPAGYTCQPYGTGQQCQPQSGTCLCTPARVGTVRSCTVETCLGYQNCAQNGSLYQWSPCDINDYNVEICDGLDNNCNHQIDEGFLNPVTGRYEDDQNCGFCNNDCSKYWSAPIDHTNGVCDTSGTGMPTCVMGPCLTEQQDGQTYEWVDVNLDPKDGCECRRVLGNTTNDFPDLIDSPAPGLSYLDENCDGIDGVIANALFVRAGSGGGDGSMQKPFPTISQAIATFPSSGKSYILVAEGTYDEEITLVPGVQLHGGYSADFRSRDVVLYPSEIRSRQPLAAIRADGIQVGATTLVSGFILRGHDISDASPADTNGVASVAVYLKDCDSTVVLRSNVIVAGRGGAGGPGSSGEAGYGRQVSAQVDGQSGLIGLRIAGTCTSGSQRPGGSGGGNPSCSTSNGNRGGTTICPQSSDPNVYPTHGAQAEYTSSANGNGLGGYDWSFDRMSGQTCSHATESGYPTQIQLNVGQDGQNGTDGPAGSGGSGGSGPYGTIAGNQWTPSSSTAGPGTPGQPGHGGGGGGGGGGTARYNQGFGDCPAYEIGPSGGGSGAGGCGGTGGLPGGAGGASLAVLVVSSTPSSAGPTLLRNLIQRGQGGQGGDGGFAGMGGIGGIGGFGGGPPDWISSKGGKGGDGGNGGPGGGGGGGTGGPSFGILGFRVSVASYAANNTFVVSDTLPTGGAAGNGGGSVGAGAPGKAGVSGAYRNTLGLAACNAGTCPAGTVCDPNQVCIPSP